MTCPVSIANVPLQVCHVNGPRKVVGMARGNREMKVVMTVPDMGLSKAEINKLKTKFKTSVVESLGGKQALARRRIIVVIIVVVIISERAA